MMNMAEERKSIEEMMEGTEKPQRDRKNWVAFVESDVVNFLTLNEIEKMTIDGLRQQGQADPPQGRQRLCGVHQLQRAVTNADTAKGVCR